MTIMKSARIELLVNDFRNFDIFWKAFEIINWAINGDRAYLEIPAGFRQCSGIAEVIQSYDELRLKDLKLPTS
jgi:hypothetical protein